MMNYTCNDCCIQCFERSRMYTCTSFKLGKLTAGEIKAQKRKNNKKTKAKTNTPKNAAQCVRKESEK